MSQSWYQLDWIWQAAGCSLVAVDTLLLLWSLFSDRAKGRRRCPKCWYDMQGVPGLRCPECGREVRGERQLAKTRRRWRRAWCSLPLLLLAYVCFNWLDYLRGGWVRLVPTALMVIDTDDLPLTDLTSGPARWLLVSPFSAFPSPRSVPQRLGSELEDRFAASTPGSIRHWILAWRAVRGDAARPLPTIQNPTTAWESTYGKWLARSVATGGGRAIRTASFQRLFRCCYRIKHDASTGTCDLVCVSETGPISLSDIELSGWVSMECQCDSLASSQLAVEYERAGLRNYAAYVPRVVGTLGTAAVPGSRLPIHVRIRSRSWSEESGPERESTLFEFTTSLQVE